MSAWHVAKARADISPALTDPVDTHASQAMVFSSGLYVGWVQHRRHAPRAHAFKYPLFMLYLDLAEIEQVFSRRWLWSAGRRNVAEFRRSDYLGDPAVPLETAVRDCVQAHAGFRPGGPIRLLAHLRYFGQSFNPVTFYYCYENDGRTLQAVVAEVTNTPWKQRHAYVLPVSESTTHVDVHAWQFDKCFHVSPFMAMEHRYAWRFGLPGEQLHVHMQVLPLHADDDTGNTRTFDATLVLQRKPINGRSLAGVLLRFPLMTLQVITAIHWQALRLWLRGNPVHDHPDNKANRR